jgi:hypothetical protein
MSTVTAEEFEKVAASLRWMAHNLDAARAVLVDGQTPHDVAERIGISEQQASVAKRRFMQRVLQLRAIKVSPDAYLASTAGASLSMFRGALLELRRHGLSDEQLVDYLAQNDVKATVAELRAEFGAAATPKRRRVRNEVHGRRKSKGRSR